MEEVILDTEQKNEEGTMMEEVQQMGTEPVETAEQINQAEPVETAAQINQTQQAERQNDAAAQMEPESNAAEPSTDNGEDLLLEQIDAFRDKAKQLQNLISAKERKVKELEALVRAKEEKNLLLQEQNRRLQEELGKKKMQADALVTDVERQVDRMMQSVKGDISAISQNLQEQVDQQKEQAEMQMQSVVSETKVSLDEIKDEVSAVAENLETARADLAEKIHNENVKVYRNVQELLKEMDHSQEQEFETEAKFKSVRIGLGVVTVFSVINLAAVAVVLLHMFGIF